MIMCRKKIIAVLVFMGTVLVSTAWGAERKEIYTATIDGSGVQKVEMLAGSYFFKPNDIIVKVNVPVEITIKKESGLAPHNIVLPAPEAGIDLNLALSTEPKVIRFTPAKAGKYPFSCDHRFLFWSHRAKGMEGVLEVTE
jgi:plastocyanin domain-containing protein